MIRLYSRTRGVALILISALLALIAFLAVGLLSAARLAAQAGFSTVAKSGASLAALSGFEYAVARLWQDQAPVMVASRTSFNACDDWTLRGKGPSYFHGEPWTDLAGGGPGTCDPGENWLDRDGDGRFDQSSGRLRGNGPTRFSLKIHSACGLACINSGELGAFTDDHDQDGTLNRDDPDYRTDMNFAWGDADLDGVPNGDDADFPGPLGNGVPDWRDPEFPGNIHIVNLLNNLGAVAGLPTRPVPFGEDPVLDGALGDIRVSDLGTLVVSNRFRGGYGSVDQMAVFMSKAEFAAVSPFLASSGDTASIGIPMVRNGAERDVNGWYYIDLLSVPERRFENHARVDLNAAPVEVIRAMLRNLAAGGGVFVRLSEEEGDKAAQAIVDARPLGDWKALLEAIDVAHKSGPLPLFQDDAFTLSLSDDFLRKEDLILAQLMSDNYFRDQNPSPAETLQYPRHKPMMGSARPVSRQVLKASLTLGRSTIPYDDTGSAQWGHNWPTPAHFPCRKTTEGFLGHRPPTRFRTVSMATSPHASSGSETAGEIEVVRTLTLIGQNDFEQPGSSQILPWRYPGEDVMAISSCLRKSGTGGHPPQGYPRFPAQSAYTGEVNYTPDSVESPPSASVLWDAVPPRTCGGIQSGAVLRPHGVPGEPWDLAQAGYSLPCNEDGLSSLHGLHYSKDSWRDNFFDPVDRGPMISQDWVSMGPTDFHRGFTTSPLGMRSGHCRIEWGLGAFPMTRVKLGGSGLESGAIAKGTIEWICRMREKHGTSAGSDPAILPPYLDVPSGEFRLNYWGWSNAPPPGQWGWSGANMRVEIKYEEGLTIHNLLNTYGPFQPATVRPWHHVALLFDSSGHSPATDSEYTDVAVYIDGQMIGSPFTVRLTGEHLDPTFACPVQLIATFPMDDLMFFPNGDPAGIAARAGTDRFERTGEYSSPMFSLASPGSGKAALKGLEWDAFAPDSADVEMTFTVDGYDASGNHAGGAQDVIWNGKTDPVLVCDIQRCHQWRFWVGFQALPTGPALLETPVVEEVRVHYAVRPRISAQSFR